MQRNQLVERLRSISDNRQPLFFMLGPCAIENEEHSLLVASFLKDLSAKLNFPLIYKSSFDKANRTSVDSFRGPGMEKGLAILEKVMAALSEGKPASSVSLEENELSIYKSFFLLTAKPVIYAANVSEEDIKNPGNNSFVKTVTEYAKQNKSICVPISAKMESELIGFSPEERMALLGEQTQAHTGVDDLIKAAFDILGLTTFFTAGEKEIKAWTIKKDTKAPQAAGVIHTDFEKGFIKAEVIKYDELIRLGSKVSVREAGLAKLEGKEYLVQDSDVIEFKFNV